MIEDNVEYWIMKIYDFFEIRFYRSKCTKSKVYLMRYVVSVEKIISFIISVKVK